MLLRKATLNYIYRHADSYAADKLLETMWTDIVATEIHMNHFGC